METTYETERRRMRLAALEAYRINNANYVKHCHIHGTVLRGIVCSDCQAAHDAKQAQ